MTLSHHFISNYSSNEHNDLETENTGNSNEVHEQWRKMKNNYVIFRKTEVSLNTLRQWIKVFLCKKFAVLRMPITISQDMLRDVCLAFSKHGTWWYFVIFKEDTDLYKLIERRRELLKQVTFAILALFLLFFIVYLLHFLPGLRRHLPWILKLTCSSLFVWVTKHSSCRWRISNCQFHLDSTLEN